MNIKEAEKQAGIQKANIRYYEEQGLIKPKRNVENNYREYAEEDIVCLKKIKALRLLDIPVAEIRQIQSKEMSLCEAVTRRMRGIEKEISELENVKSLCNVYLDRNLTYETLDVSLLETRESLSVEKGAVFMKIDKCRNYKEAYERSTRVLTFYALLIMLPTSSNIQEWLHYSLPGWMRVMGIAGTAMAGIISVIFYILMYKEQTKRNEAAFK